MSVVWAVGLRLKPRPGRALAPGQRLGRLCVRWAPEVSHGQTSLVCVLEEYVSKDPPRIT